MNIAILGGAFDPPHVGHYFVATQVKEILKMDEVWLMPCYSYFPEFPVKFSRITTPEMRMDMVRFMSDSRLKISDFEYKENKKSRTIDTLRLLQKNYPQHTFSWIIGSDSLPSFQLWDEWQELVHKHNLIFFPRDTDFKTLKARVLQYLKLSSLPENIIIIEGELVVSNIASTHIRKRVRAGLPIVNMILPEVEKYIRKNTLYV